MRSRFARAAFAALTVVAFAAPVEVVRAQGGPRALVYCPVPIDDIGCNAIVKALAPLYLGGVDKGYDGSGGTLDLATADLQGYRVIVIPSLADDSTAAPYGLLRDPAIASRLHGVLFGRSAFWSGTPDQGSASRAEKDALIQNLATWAGGNFARVLRPGLVVLQDQSANTASRYDWLRGIVDLQVVADSAPNVFSSVKSKDPAAAEILSYLGAQLSYPNMASYGYVPAVASSTSSAQQAGMSSSGGSVLLTVAASVSSAAAITTDKPDYAPGETVIITGTGFKPGENVTITLQEDPQLHPQVVLTSTADASGNFTNTQFKPDQHDNGIRFVATAVGDSGSTAQTTFTDANPSAPAAGPQSPNPTYPASTATYTLTITYTGNNQSCTVNLSATPTATPSWPSTPPPGGFFSFSPASLTSTGAAQTSTLTVTTPAGMAANTYQFTVTATIVTAGTCQGGNETSALIPLVVAANVGTTLSLAAPSPASVSFGSAGPVTLSATLTRTTGGAAVVGATINFTVDASSVGTAVTNASGVASISTYNPSALTVGPHSVQSSFAGGVVGGTGYAASTSGTQTLTVNKAATTTTVTRTSGNNPSTYGQSVQFTGTVTSAVGAPGGSVTFYDGGTCATPGPTLAGPTALVSGAASFTTTALTASGSPHTILACYGGATNYDPSNGSLAHTVNKAVLTVTADNASRTYGDANPTFTATITGFVNGENLATSGVTGSPGLTTTATPTSPVSGNPYAIVPALGTLTAGNYTFSFVNGQLTVLVRPITVTADAKSKVYGDADPPLTYQITTGSLVGSDAFTGSLTRVAGESVTGSPYAVQQGTLALNTNYALTYIGANLSITARPITVTADAQTKVYGDADPTFTYQVTSGTLVSGDGFSGALTRVAGQNVGTYAIQQGTLTAGSNYALTFVSANLTITARPITVTADAKTKVYGDSDPALTYQITTGSLAFTDAFTGGLTRATGENIGTYAITQGTLALSTNYTLTFVGASLTITPRPITATADAKTKVYGNADPALTYQITAGSLAFSDAFTGALTRAAGENVGTYAITQGTLALTTNYTLTYVGANFTITPRPITVTADAQTKVYGNTDPMFTYQLTSGTLVSGDGFSGALTRAAGENVGTYAIQQGTLTAGSNYALTFVSANLTITPRPITVTADAQTKVYGNADPTFTYQITSGSLAFSDAFSGVLGRAGGENVGTYAITVGSLTAGTNYTLTFVGANLTITPRPITVTADARTKVYGDSDPALTYQITAGSLAFADAFTGGLTRATGENIGTYAITQGTLALTTNYTLTFVGANLTITPRPITVTADAKTKVYGNADPALTYQITAGSLAFSDAFTGALTRAAGENVGTYAITQGTLALSTNYTLTYVGANLAITPKPLTISVVSISKNFGAVTPPALAFSVTYSAFAFAETPAVLTGTLVFTPGAATFTNTTVAGVYPISAYGLSHPNYAITYVPGTFTIFDTTAPIVSGSMANPNPVPLNTATTITANISDAITGGSSISSACYTINYGNGPGACTSITGTFGTVSVNVSVIIPGQPTTDVFEVCVYGTDSATPANTNAKMDCVLVAVYDPDAGFVTGGGWIMSPAGAYVANPSLTGKATFGFVAKYRKGQQTPEGNSEFQFHAAGMNFKSTSYDWLVVAGSRAQYKGVGTINGTGSYGFLLTALDGDLSGNKKPDSFRMKIWLLSSGAVVYDNNIGVSDTADPATTLGGGSIVIHSK